MKNKKTIIIIIAAVVVLAAVVVVACVGFNQGWIGGDDELEVSQIYSDDGGYVEREEFYNKKGELEYKVIKGYSDAEKTKLSRETYMTPDDKVIKIVNYNEGGVISSVDEYNGSKISSHREYVNGEATGSYFTYEYSDSGLLLNSAEYSADNKLIKNVKREYNQNDLITLYLETGPEGNQIAKTVYEYNADGREKKVVFYDGTDVTGHVEYEYDSEGRRTKMSEFVNGELSNYRTYTYDKNGTAQETIHRVGEE